MKLDSLIAEQREFSNKIMQMLNNHESQKVESIPKSVYLLDEPDEDEDYSLADSMIILMGECDLLTDADESSIRSELVKHFKANLLYILNNDFDFVTWCFNVLIWCVSGLIWCDNGVIWCF